jgi:hypothetical protein
MHVLIIIISCDYPTTNNWKLGQIISFEDFVCVIIQQPITGNSDKLSLSLVYDTSPTIPNILEIFEPVYCARDPWSVFEN